MNPDMTDKLAPYPRTEREATAEAMVRYMAVVAHTTAAVNTPRHMRSLQGDQAAVTEYLLGQESMTAEQGVVFLLRELMARIPDQADEIASRLWELWESPPVLAYTWGVLEEYGMDAEEVAQATRDAYNAASAA